MNSIELIKEICASTASQLIKVSESGTKQYHSILIRCEDLKDWNQRSFQASYEFKNEYLKLKELRGPVLYYFEIIEDADNEKVYHQLKKYRNNPSAKATPAIKGFCNPNTKILYVGKVKTNFCYRFIQHLGYFTNGQTQGLQLYHWTKGLNMLLNLHIYEFDSETEDLMALLEYRISKDFQPLIGKHK